MVIGSVILQGTRAAQPLATSVQAGFLYGVTDEGNKIERSDGSAWQAFSPLSGAVPSLISANTEYTTGSGIVISESLQIAAGVRLTIDGGARLHMQKGDPDCGYIRMGCDAGPTPASTVNYSTVGTFDWYVPTGTTVPQTSLQTMHGKALGGWLRNSYEIIYGGGAPTISTQTAGFTLASTASDDFSSSGALSSVSETILIGNAGMGFRYRVPASKKRRVLVVYGKHVGGTITWKASMANSAVPSRSLVTQDPNATTVTPLIRVEFSGQGDMIFSGICSVGTGITMHAGAAYVYDAE